jgi:histidine phosphatase superfamily protein (branch 2)
MAGVLLDDMFSQIQAKVDGTSQLIAVLRFTHAEEIFPLATLLGLPSSTKQLPVGAEFTHADDPLRGANVAPMGANIQWDVFHKGGTYLVRMLYNEKQTAFKAGCTPIAKGSYYYDLTELEHCYDWSPSSS